MTLIIWVEFVDGVKKEIYADDVCEGKQRLKYIISSGLFKGEYNIPLCQIRTYKIER